MAQGAAAPGGAKTYVVKDVMPGGFALIAWPAESDLTGVMTFIVGPDGVVRQQESGAEDRRRSAGDHLFQPRRLMGAGRVGRMMCGREA